MTSNQDVDDPFATLESLYREGDISAVRGLLAQSMDQDPAAPEVSRVLGLIMARWGETDAAIALLETTLLQVPGHAPLHNDLGMMYQDQGRLMEAGTSFQRALQCDPSYQPAQENIALIKTDALLQIASTEWRAGNLSEALHRLSEATMLSPEHAEARAAHTQARQAVQTVLDEERQRTPLEVLPSDSLLWARLQTLFREAVLICALNPEDTERWWTCLELDSLFCMNSVPMLRTLLNNYVLHRAGDFRSYLRISRELEALGALPGPVDTFFIQLAERFEMDLRAMDAEVRPSSSDRSPILLAFPVWGKAHTDLFLTSCLPSLLEDGNLPYLCRTRAPILLIHTDEDGEQAIRSAPAMAHLEAQGLELRILRLDSGLLQRVSEHENFKYWHLGLIQSLELAYARRLGSDYHLVLPDTLYCAGYFRRLLEAASRGNSVILQAAFRTDGAELLRAIAPHRLGDVISVEAPDLMAFALNCLHPSMNSLLMNNRPAGPAWPAHHATFWEEDTTLRMISPHQSPAFVKASLLAKVGDRFFFTLDSELDKLIEVGETVHAPLAQDGLVLAELSPVEIDAPKEPYTDATRYARLFWQRVENRRHLTFFNQENAFPINPAKRTAREPFPTERSDQEMAYLRDLVARHYPTASVPALVNGLLSLQEAEKHPLAEDRLPELREAARLVWESGKESVSPSALTDPMHHVLRNLWHFDLLPEAEDCLRRHAPDAPMRRTLETWNLQRAANTVYAQQLNLTEGEAKKACVIGVTVWGPAYLEFFLNYHLPSLLAEGNIPYLARRGKVILSIVTDTEGEAILKASSALGPLLQHAELRLTVVDRVPTGDRHSQAEAAWFYWHFGLLDHHHVYLARDIGASLIMMPPDTIISRFGYQTLAQQIDAGFDCCTIACIEARREQILPDLEPHRGEGVLSMDAGELANLAIRHKTEYFKSLIVDERQEVNSYPRELFWRVSGGYVCHSLFMHPTMLSARVMSRKFHPNHENVDWALLPRTMQGDGKVKVLDSTSGLFILHCSEKTARENEMSQFRGIVTPWLMAHLLGVHDHDYPIHRRLFHRPQFFRLEDPAVPVTGRYLADITALLAAFDGTLPQFG